MKLLLSLILVTLLTSCTTYFIEKVAPDGTRTTVKVRTSRDIDEPSLRYAREGADATFDFNAKSVDDSADDVSNMVLQALLAGKLVVK